MLTNLSIGKKIVGLSLVLLSLMLGASIYSYIQTNRVHSASAEVTGVLVPLSAQIAAVEMNTLEQALMLERVLRHRSAEDRDEEQANLEKARFEELSTRVDSEVKAAEQSIRSGLAATRLIDYAMQLAALEPEIEALDRDHRSYSEAGLELIRAHRAAIPALRERLSAEEDRLDESIERLSRRLDSAGASEAQQLQGREQRAYLISTESLAAACMAFLTGSILSALVTRRLVRPVRALITGAQEVTRGNLDVAIEASSRDEVGQLARAFQNMIVELRSKARIKETFGKYMDPRVVERLLETGQSTFGVGEKRVMTVFFSDLQGFSGISELLTAAGLVNLINQYLTLASQPIVENQGVIDKYIGDAIMAFWGPPFYGEPDHARRACLAALAQQEQLMELKRILPDVLGFRRNLPELNVRIGLCTGELIAGSIGSNVSKSFTVMGDTVNTASRLESANKQFGTRILIDSQTFDMVRGDMEARELDLLAVVGKADAVRVYELLGEKRRVEAPRLEMRDAFEAGLKAYRAREWHLANEHFATVLGIDPHDKPALLYRERVRAFRENAPPEHWDGVWRLSEK